MKLLSALLVYCAASGEELHQLFSYQVEGWHDDSVCPVDRHAKKTRLLLPGSLAVVGQAPVADSKEGEGRLPPIDLRIFFAVSRLFPV